MAIRNNKIKHYVYDLIPPHDYIAELMVTKSIYKNTTSNLPDSMHQSAFDLLYLLHRLNVRPIP